MRTFQSVIEQSYENFEWILIDDYSNDKTWDLLKKMKAQDDRIVIKRSLENLGAAGARNMALDMATGEYTAFLDSDDLWAPNKLKKQVEFMRKKSLRFSYHNFYLINGEDEKIKVHHVKSPLRAYELLKFNPFGTSSIMIHASITDSLRFKKHLVRKQDYIYWYEALGKAKRGLGLVEPLSSYRIFAHDSLSRNKLRMAKAQWDLYKEEFNLGFFQRVKNIFKYMVYSVLKYYFS